MKILAGILATALAAAPAFAQGGSAASAPAPQAGAHHGGPADRGTETVHSNATTKPAAPEPEQAPAGTTPVKPADTPKR